jgi:DNA-binding response OmpR family regulator
MSASVNDKYKVLVVGDDLDVNTTMVFLLEFDGHEVRTVDSAEAALAMLATTGFDLIITEYTLPLMNGDEFASLVKAQWPEQRIIMATAHFEGSNVEDSSSVVADCLLNKPFTMQQLRAAMNWAFEGAVETRSNILHAHLLPANAVVNLDNPRSVPNNRGG